MDGMGGTSRRMWRKTNKQTNTYINKKNEKYFFGLC